MQHARTVSYANQIRIIIPILLHYTHERLYTIYIVRLNGIRVIIQYYNTDTAYVR